MPYAKKQSRKEAPTDASLPHSIEAEESIIGAVLVHARTFADVKGLGADDFYHPALRAIYEAMLELDAAKKPINSISVVEQMKSSATFDKLRAFNGADYLADLTARVVTVENLGHLARIVRDKSIARQAFEVASQLRQAIASGEHGPGVVEVYSQRLIEIGRAVDGRAPAARAAAQIQLERVEWVWRGRIAAGMINVLDGDPGLGKSTLTTDLAARISRGEALPGDDIAAPPAGVVLVSFEEHPGAVMVPRLMAAGADLSRVVVWDLAARPFDLVQSLAELQDIIAMHQARLVVIDPLMAALPAELNAHRDQDVRSVLSPVATLAEQTGAAILLVRHLNKNGAGSALYRGGGSIGIIGAARCGLLLAQDPDAEDDEAARVLATTKCNVARPAPALRLRLVAAPAPAPGVEVARIEWGGAAKSSADDLVQPREDHTAIGTAVELLRQVLMDGPVLASEAQAALRANDVSPRTETRAKQRLDIVARRDGVKGKWWWYLPEQLAPQGANGQAQ